MKAGKHPWNFFIIIFSISWFFWGAIILMALEISQMPAPLRL